MADERTIEELIKALAEMQSPAAQDAARKLQETGNEAVLPLINALKDENVNIAAQAALLLGGFNDKRAVFPLMESMKDTRGVIAYWSVCSLGHLGGESVFDVLIEALKEPKTRQTAADALGNLKDERAVEPLIASLYADADETYASELELENSEDTEHWKRADFFSRLHIYALVEIGGPKVIEPLIEALTSSDDRVCGAAIDGLKMIGLPAVDPLINAFPKLRKIDGGDWIIWLLGEIGDNRAFDVVMDALDDNYAHIRHTAASALGGLKDKRAIPRLVELLSDDDEWMRKFAREALVKLGYSTD